MRMRHQTRFLALFLTAMALGCKPTNPNISQTLESGGTRQAWSMSAVLNPAGELYVDSSGEGAEAKGNWFKALDLQVNGANDGQVYSSSFADKKWMALQIGDAGIAFDILATTDGNMLCYANAAKLDGTAYEVACKDAATVSSSDADRKREELARACERLASKRIEGESGYYARYDRERNRLVCTCLNGKARDVEYADYASSSVATFEDACMARDGTTPPSSAGRIGELAAADSDLGRVQRVCMAGITGASLSPDKQTCRCPSGNLPLSEYLGKISELENDCD